MEQQLYSLAEAKDIIGTNYVTLRRYIERLNINTFESYIDNRVRLIHLKDIRLIQEAMTNKTIGMKITDQRAADITRTI